MFKKLFFSLPFLALFYLFLSQLAPFFKDIYFIFNLEIQTLINLLILIALLSLSTLFFVIFSTLANDWKIVLPISALSSAAPFILFTQPTSFLMAAGTLGSLILTNFTIRNKMATYIDFKPPSLLNPSIKTLATLLILVISVTFYLKANMEIKQKGFEIPDSLIDAALKVAAPEIPVKGVKFAQVSLTPEQIELLKQNPDLLRQQGIDPSVLDSLPTKPVSPKKPSIETKSPQSDDFIKTLVKNQFQKMLEPYLSYIPAVLAVLFFFTLQFFLSIILLPMPILVAGVFWILEKTGYIHFEKEMREVKKLVV